MERSRRIVAILASVLILTGVLSPTAPPASADPPDDYWILAGDQGSAQLIAFDPAVSDWNSSAAVKWSWQPTTALGFTASEIAAFSLVSGFKLRNTPAGQRIVVTSSGGLAAVISYPAGVKQWAQVLPASHNLHAADILPNGNVAITSTHTSSGYVRVYAASQGPSASNYAQYSLNGQSHGVLWDPITERLWVVGKQGSGPNDPRVLTALAVTGTAAAPRLTEDMGKWNELPDIGGHDLNIDPNDPNILLVTADMHTYEYDKTASTDRFTEIPAAAGGLEKVKGISRQYSGQTVQTRPDSYKSPQGPCAAVNTWCTDTVDFYGPDMTRTRTGAQFYKARVMNPYRTAIGDTAHGPVSDRVLPSGGSWTTPATIDTNTAITAISAAALPDGTLHVLTLLPGSGIWHRVRDAAGSWSTASKIDSNTSITAISAAGLSNGTLQVQAVVPGSGVWNRSRNTAGTWSTATQIDSNGSISAVSAAALGDVLHVQTLVPGSGVWNRTRSSGGTWSTSTKIAEGCEGTGANNPCITDISAAGLPGGTVHVQTLIPGSGVFNLVRSTGGTWSAPSLIDANDSITRISATAMPDGTVQLQTVIPGFGFWNRVRGTGGTWSSATKIDSSTTVFETYGVGLPNGDLHIGHIDYSS